MIDLKKIVRKNIWNTQAYSSARSEFTSKEGIFLDANENPYGTYNRYPDPNQKELKEKVAKIKAVLPENIFVGNGSDEVIDLAFRIFCNPGTDKALIFSPTYGMYQVAAAINDVTIIDIPLTSDFQIDIKKVTPLIEDKKLKIIFICSPNNPTGNSIHNSSIDFLLENFNGIIFMDEAYIDFTNDNSYIKAIQQHNNLIISQTMSKAWGLAANRIGLAFSHPEIINLYNKIKPPYNVSTLNQEAAIKVLNNEAIYRQNIQKIQKEKERLMAALSTIPKIKKIYPTNANFILIEVENANALYESLILQKIITRNRHSYIPNCIRITIGTEEENTQLLYALKN